MANGAARSRPGAALTGIQGSPRFEDLATPADAKEVAW